MGKPPRPPPRVCVYVGGTFLHDLEIHSFSLRVSPEQAGTLQLHAAFQKPLPAWVCACVFPFETSQPPFQAAPALRSPPLHPQLAALHI